MKMFVKLLVFLSALTAALVGLSLLAEEKENRYISVYDSDDDLPF